MDPKKTIYSAGDCPVCFSSGLLLVIISTAFGDAVFYCPACETAWDDLPRSLERVQSLTELAPLGAGFATKEEAESVSVGGIVPVAYEEWANNLKGIS